VKSDGNKDPTQLDGYDSRFVFLGKLLRSHFFMDLVGWRARGWPASLFTSMRCIFVPPCITTFHLSFIISKLVHSIHHK